MDKKNLKLAFFIGNMSNSGGTERVLSVIASGLADRGYHVSIISLKGSGQTFFPVSEKVRIYWLEEAARTGIIRKIQSLAAFLNQENIDFLIDVDIILCFYSFFLKWLRPQMHWISWEHFNFYYHFRKNNFLRSIARRLVAAFSEHLVVLSEEDKGYYRKNLKLKCGISRIYNPNPYEDAQPKRTWEPVILAAGRLTKVKGFDLLIKSWQLLENRYPEWKVLVAGEGIDRKKLESQIKAAGLTNFHLIGNVMQIEKYYGKAEIFVLPSRDEGFGMVLLEAMAYSVPVVSYSCKAGPKEIVTDGENGYLVPPGEVELFARKMEALMADEAGRREMGRRAKESTRRFDKEPIIDEWEGLLNNMVKQAGTKEDK